MKTLIPTLLIFIAKGLYSLTSKIMSYDLWVLGIPEEDLADKIFDIEYEAAIGEAVFFLENGEDLHCFKLKCGSDFDVEVYDYFSREIYQEYVPGDYFNEPYGCNDDFEDAFRDYKKENIKDHVKAWAMNNLDKWEVLK